MRAPSAGCLHALGRCNCVVYSLSLLCGITLQKTCSYRKSCLRAIRESLKEIIVCRPLLVLSSTKNRVVVVIVVVKHQGLQHTPARLRERSHHFFN